MDQDIAFCREGYRDEPWMPATYDNIHPRSDPSQPEAGRLTTACSQSPPGPDTPWTQPGFSGLADSNTPQALEEPPR